MQFLIGWSGGIGSGVIYLYSMSSVDIYAYLVIVHVLNYNRKFSGGSGSRGG